MIRPSLALGACIVISLFATQSVAAEGSASENGHDSAQAIRLFDTHGTAQAPLDLQGRKATVLFFLLPDCPVSNAYAPEIKRICADYANEHVATFIVYVDPDLSAEDARRHAQDFGYNCPVLRDTNLELVRHTGVTIAPEVALLGSDGRLVYRGRIDDLYAGYGKRRAQASQHDLRDALDALLEGRDVPRSTTKAIGCFISTN